LKIFGFIVEKYCIKLYLIKYYSIIRRLTTLTAEEARLIAECEASQKQAKSATDMAKRLMEEQDNRKNKVYKPHECVK